MKAAYKKDINICVSNLKSGQTGIITELNTNNESILRKLMSMSILPGVKIKVIQSFPSYVIEVGYTQVAIDKDIASVIAVDILL